MRLAVLLLALALAGCGGKTADTTDFVTVAQPYKPPPLPAECTSKDPKWTVLPDADIDKATLPRTDRINANAYTEVLGKRRVCREAILELNKKR